MISYFLLHTEKAFFVANNQAQKFWAFSASEPNFEPAARVTAPAPLTMHTFSKAFK